MTLYSKANLEVVAAASRDEYDRAMCGVRLEPDGATVAGNRRILMAVGPADEERVHFPDVGPRSSPGSAGLLLAPDFVAEVLKTIPKDKRVSLQHAAMTQPAGGDGLVEFTTKDRSGRQRRTADRPKREVYPDWRGMVRKAREPGEENARLAMDGRPLRVCVNRKDLIELLKALEAACPDKGDENPVFIEVGKGLVLRCQNRETGQRAIGVAAPYRLPDGAWPTPDAWEKTVEGESAEVRENTAEVEVRRVVRRKPPL